MGTGAEDVRLLVPTENGVWFTAVSDRIFNSSPPFQLHASSPIVTWLRFHDDALKKEELLGEPRYLPLSEKERAALESSRIQLFVPLKHREDLAGILALAGKRSEEPYSERDLSLLRTTTNQAAMWVSTARMFASVSSQRSRLENLLERAVQTQENERKRLAMELHDSPVQWLTSAVYHLEACLESFRRGEKRMTGRELQEVQETLNKSLEELRHTAAALYPPGLEKQGLLKTMGHYAERFERDSGIRTSFQPSGSVPRLSAQVELATYRVVQEALSNVRKHSQATEVQLQMGLHNGAVWASIRDNGTGFEVDDTGKAENGHLGLASMEERAHMLGGTLGVQSAPDFGTQITLLIPSVERNGGCP